MKLKSLVVVTLSIIPVLSFANMSFDDDNGNNPFAGLFVGLGAGYNHTQAKYTASNTSDTISKNAALGQALLGYNYGIDSNWLVGAEFSFTYDSAKITENAAHGVFTTTTKMPDVYGIDALLGYAFSQSMMAFVGAGGAASDLKISTNTGYSSSDSFIGWKGLVGAQQGLVGGLSVRETVSYTSYKPKNINISSTEHKVQPRNYAGVVSLVYTFNI